MCQLPPKKPNIEKKNPKSQTIFLMSTASKKSQNCELWRQKSQSGNPDSEMKIVSGDSRT